MLLRAADHRVHHDDCKQDACNADAQEELGASNVVESSNRHHASGQVYERTDEQKRGDREATRGGDQAQGRREDSGDHHANAELADDEGESLQVLVLAPKPPVKIIDHAAWCISCQSWATYSTV